MKKLVIALAIIAAAAIAQEQTFKFPGWACTDMALIQQQTAAATNEWERWCMSILSDFAQNGNPATIDAARDRVAAAIQLAPPSFTVNPVDFAKSWAREVKISSETIKQFCVSNPSMVDLDLIMWASIHADPEWG